MLLALTYQRKTIGPEMWCKERSADWWSNAIVGNYGESWWRENLRMSKETFLILCNERQMTRFRQPISVEARLALTIWRLGTNVEYRTIAGLFGLGRSTVGEIVMSPDVEVCEDAPR